MRWQSNPHPSLPGTMVLREGYDYEVEVCLGSSHSDLPMHSRAGQGAVVLEGTILQTSSGSLLGHVVLTFPMPQQHDARGSGKTFRLQAGETPGRPRKAHQATQAPTPAHARRFLSLLMNMLNAIGNVQFVVAACKMESGMPCRIQTDSSNPFVSRAVASYT